MRSKVTNCFRAKMIVSFVVLLMSSPLLAKNYSIPYGLRWGMGQKEVEESLKGKLDPIKTEKSEEKIGDSILSYKGKIEDVEAKEIQLEFKDNSLISFSATIKDSGTPDHWKQILLKVKGSYGEPEKIKEEAGNMGASWKFSNDTIVAVLFDKNEKHPSVSWLIASTSVMNKHKEEQQKKEQEEEVAYWNSADGTLDKACTVRSKMKRQQEIIDYQKKVGKEVGVVDMSVLHDAGSRVVSLKQEMKDLELEYKIKTGGKKKFDFSRCVEH